MAPRREVGYQSSQIWLIPANDLIGREGAVYFKYS
jgi:hypothetical protein